MKPTTIACVAFILGLPVAEPRVPQTAARKIVVLSADVFTGTLDELAGQFQRTSGHEVSVVYGTAGEIRRRVEAGEFCDVAILPRPMLEDLQQRGRVRQQTIVDLARSAVGVAVRSGAPSPDVSSVAAFKRLLAEAKSISYPNPDRGGATGVLVKRVLQQLGMADQVGAKTKFPLPGQFPATVVAQGDAEIAIAQPMEVLTTRGAQLVGLLPTELQDPPNFLFSSGIIADSKEPDVARALVRFLTGPVAGALFKAKGMNPVK